MRRYLWSYRWQIGLLPFFVASVWLATSLEVAGDKKEFVTIAVFYAIADILIVNYFVAQMAIVRVLSQCIAMTIFASIFFFTYIAYGEAQYALAQPLFWVAGWKIVTREYWKEWYPHFLSPHVIALYAIAAIGTALWAHLSGLGVPTIINVLQTIGLCGFGFFLATQGELRVAQHARFLGLLGLDMYVLTCVGDVVHKYVVSGDIIATPLVAFLAALPVAIVATRDMFVPMRVEGI